MREPSFPWSSGWVRIETTTAYVFVAGRMWPLSQVDWYTVGTAGEPQSISLRPKLEKR